MAQHVEAGPGGGIGRHPGRPAQLKQFAALAGQHAAGIGRIQGLQLHPAEDQGTVVVEGTAQPQLQLQYLPSPPALGQQPAAGGVEQVSLVHQLAIHPQLHRVGPPTQRQAGGHRRPGPLQGLPGRRAGEPQIQLPPLPAPGPDHQPPGLPVGPMPRPPGMIQGTDRLAIHPWAAPERPQIPGSTGVGRLVQGGKRFKLVSEPRPRGLSHRWMAKQVP